MVGWGWQLAQCSALVNRPGLLLLSCVTLASSLPRPGDSMSNHETLPHLIPKLTGDSGTHDTDIEVETARAEKNQ